MSQKRLVYHKNGKLLSEKRLPYSCKDKPEPIEDFLKVDDFMV